MSTGPKSIPEKHHRRTHGIYAKQFTDEEVALYQSIPVGNVDQEIRLHRVRLRRALAAEKAAKGEVELEEVTEHDLIGEEGSREDRKSKVRDYANLIAKESTRIESLEKTRRELLKAGDDPDEDDKRPIGRIVVEVVSARASHDHDRAAG